MAILRNLRWVSAVAGMTAVFSFHASAIGAAESSAAAPSASRRGELINLVRQDCGSCHGLTLKGGLGPALLPDALHGKPASSLVATILQGRPGTAMPPWRPFLTEPEVGWIVEQLQKGFPHVPHVPHD